VTLLTTKAHVREQLPAVELPSDFRYVGGVLFTADKQVRYPSVELSIDARGARWTLIISSTTTISTPKTTVRSGRGRRYFAIATLGTVRALAFADGSFRYTLIGSRVPDVPRISRATLPTAEALLDAVTPTGGPLTPAW
jgi:hypothetical protein